jgi:hypothetical protein
MVHYKNLVQPELKVRGKVIEVEPAEQLDSKLCLVLS